MWLVLSHQEPQTQYKSEIKEKTLSRQESLDGLRISQKSAKTPLFTEFSDGLGGGLRASQFKNTKITRRAKAL
jgi:hypothetical protein